ncbi:beta-propeller domain-containing protein [Natronomonas salina]|uniref:beta-propeller domain-containing protein n=1 Tax=Natronomonas salina TaxID=1710540 RepID=UPI0015B6A608|nr:beta-propeller domain-containing protein [Natronomonas salina]QLD90062.1 beta-propeller domain-containing protein [Natronomonas salina]
MSRVSLSTLQLAALLTVALAAGGVGAALLDDVQTQPHDRTQPDDPTGVSTFDSAEEFRSYLRAADATGRHAGFASSARTGADVGVATDDAADGAAASGPVEESDTGGVRPTDAGAGGGGSAGDRRASDTNVQVEGIDEPDVLKTTAETLYYSTDGQGPHHRSRGGADDRPGSSEGVRLIDADDPAAPEVAGRLDVSGDLLLAGDTLVVVDGGTLAGYDVSDRSNPERTWSKDLEARVVAARLHAGTVYLVTEDRVDRRNPCPVRPMEGVSVPCTDVHHPSRPVPVDTTYTVSLLDPADGSVADSTSFVGTAGRSVVHVSADAVYVTYPDPVDEADLMAEFLVTEGSEHLDGETVERIREIRDYDLSPRAKRVEIEHTIERWRAGLSEEERREVDAALREERQAWAEENKRDFERTGVVAFDVEGVETDSPTVEAGATGSVPGTPLNQFSMDEHEGQFRIATTVRGAMGTDSENDLYVLDGDLDVTGSVRGMGVTERIYSVRYVDDQAYVVTFRRIDPFHVVDLSDPENPTVEGELKLPGFSSYLHPLSEDRVLGVGEEDGKVKLVVFDVSDPADPTVEEDRILDARFSAVAESHHAFLLDRRHGVFFLPTDGGRSVRPVVDEDGDAVDVEHRGSGYVFSYEGGLEEVTRVESEGSTRRAAYVGDHLYVFGESSLTVVDETTWEETATLNFTDG